MYFLILAVSLTALLGVRCESPPLCYEEPECLRRPPLTRELVENLQETEDTLPSNDFFEQICTPLVENLRCIRDYENACSISSSMDFDAVVDAFVEFCNESSSIRIAYMSHVECFNSINFTAETCFTTFRDTLGSFMEEANSLLEEKSIHSHCLLLHMLTPCVVDATRESCGDEAAVGASGIMSGLQSFFRCRDEHTVFFEEVLAGLNSIGD